MKSQMPFDSSELIEKTHEEGLSCVEGDCLMEKGDHLGDEVSPRSSVVCETGEPPP